MTKVLKLTGLQSYVGRATLATVIKKGESCKFSDEVADKIMEGGIHNTEGEHVPYWREVADSTPIMYDFSEVALAARPNAPKRLLEEADADPEVDESPAPAPAKQRVTTRQPKPSAATAN